MFAIAYPTARVLKFREHRPAVVRMASALVDQQVELVALPLSMRPEVPQLLKKGITPVLYDPTRTASQQFALLNVTHQIGGNPPSLMRLELEKLRSTPLGPGQTIREEFSRPYIYSPIQRSFKLTSKTQLERSVFLAGGSYELKLEVFFKRNTPEPTISALVAVSGAPTKLESFGAQPIVRTPTILPFEAPHPGGDVVFTVKSSSTAFVHAWEIQAK